MMERGAKTAEPKEILRARARELAREPVREEVGERLDTVVFQLAYEQYAVESKYVLEVAPLRDLTPLPCVPSFVAGLINLRGDILSIVNLKKFFDLPEKGLTDLNKVIVLRSSWMEMGILADAVVGVRSLPLKEIQPSLTTLTGIRGEYLRGVTGDGIVVLDGEKILSDKKLIIHEEVEVRRQDETLS